MPCLCHAYVMLTSCLRHASVSIVFVRALLHPSTHDIVVLEIEFECLSARLFDAGGHAADEERQDARRRSVREPDRGASCIHHRQRIPRIVRQDIYVQYLSPAASRHLSAAARAHASADLMSVPYLSLWLPQRGIRQGHHRHRKAGRLRRALCRPPRNSCGKSRPAARD